MLTRSMDYTLAIYELIASRGDAITNVAVITENVEVTYKYAEQICHRLRAAGFVRSFRGPGGGYLPTGKLPTMMELCNLMSQKHTTYTFKSKCARELFEFAETLTIGNGSPPGANPDEVRQSPLPDPVQ